MSNRQYPDGSCARSHSPRRLHSWREHAPAHYAWAEDEPAATAQADATLPDAAPLEEAPPEVAALAPIENAPHLDLKDGSILLKDSGSNLQYSQDNEATWT